MRAILVVMVLLSGCEQSPSAIIDGGSDMAQSPSRGDLAMTDAAAFLKCSWTLADPAATGSIAVTSAPIPDGRTQCIMEQGAIELVVPRVDGHVDDFIVATGPPAVMHLYRLMEPGQALAEAACDQWTGTLTMAPTALPSVQFDLTCTLPEGGYHYWDMGTHTTHIAGSFSVSY